MSNRALRKIHGGKDDLSTLASSLQLEEEDNTPVIRNVNGNRKKKPAINMFDLVCNFFSVDLCYLNLYLFLFFLFS